MKFNESKSTELALFFLGAALLIASVAVLWPYYQYYVDPDAISYLKITQNYINGDYQNAINGFWSPMGCWLTALLVKWTDWPIFASAIVVNSCAALGAFFASLVLFRKFNTDTFTKILFTITNSLFWSYTVYFQSFTDNWQFFFLLIILNIFLNNNYTYKPGKWIITGILAALAYYGKAFSFIFFPVMSLALTAWLLKQDKSFSLSKWIKINVASISVMIIVSLPWIFLLYQKYNIVTYSTAGTLNMAWWIVGTQQFKDGINIVVPPPYTGSLFYFEDPYLAQGYIAKFWHSPQLFVKQLLRIGYNVIGWFDSCNRISAFYFITWLVTVLLLFKKNIRLQTNKNMGAVAIVFLLFPLPFWLLTFNGGRYLWITIPLMCILTLYFSQKVVFPYLNKQLQKLFISALFLSILITPIADMKNIFNAGKEEFSVAQQLKAMNIKGAFVSNYAYEDAAEYIIRLSWFSQNAWYCHPLNNYSIEMLIEDAKRYPVKYYFYFYKGTNDDYQYIDEKHTLKPDLTQGKIKGLKVYEIGN